jgi:hypothetical protein
MKLFVRVFGVFRGYVRAVQTLVEDFLPSLRHERGQLAAFWSRRDFHRRSFGGSCPHIYHLRWRSAGGVAWLLPERE